MIESNVCQSEKSASAQHWVATLLEERSAVWSLYCKIGNMLPLNGDGNLRSVLSEFSQLLIDYISLGHFGIYEHLLTDRPEQSSALSYAERIYPAFSKITASAVSFSDTYDEGRRKFRTDNLLQDLSVLGEHLAERMELEDRLCSMLLH
ncbi:Rsd/AlgQ family anti-sigma factor [Methylomonas koyamae]|uniref:Rsd/AlgQ family anti-sigma factor n=1 Tax=Methylomonas koyamae TaxID=702114 RepID=UPI000AEC9787|nr:Rsd/AlgQ family anti-sigma factor [Methylomonas koyamae]ATG88646.1 regulator [Methylomonas koyamae]WNB76306.1 Rsd/AlgQ family anti-sigma factor [Methylomonas koyamae]